mgnify:CR=1 FL=1
MCKSRVVVKSNCKRHPQPLGSHPNCSLLLQLARSVRSPSQIRAAVVLAFCRRMDLFPKMARSWASSDSPDRNAKFLILSELWTMNSWFFDLQRTHSRCFSFSRILPGNPRCLSKNRYRDFKESFPFPFPGLIPPSIHSFPKILNFSLPAYSPHPFISKNSI